MRYAISFWSASLTMVQSVRKTAMAILVMMSLPFAAQAQQFTVSHSVDLHIGKDVEVAHGAAAGFDINGGKLSVAGAVGDAVRIGDSGGSQKMGVGFSAPLSVVTTLLGR